MSHTFGEMAVIELCELIGYGRVMQIAEEKWRKKDPVGALIVVCCAAEEKTYRAAPDLLKALKRFVHIYDRQGANGCGQTVQPVPPEIAAARAAIAKAEGEE